ncbi:hypothetical protein QTI24_08445 [Variovorax sp. J22P240]|uniref:hypothetical protein n=1 Tax=Variovorax sp. J22P240 TaxID=3053514 RepID=UPI00257746EC|nr:hypothetical protein [Variovorax sp. J22P240]MDL9998625.1 hypothetical protein [Variovorax sp. J22P240]
MAIDIFCYAAKEVEVVNRLMTELQGKEVSYFSSDFIVSPIKEAAEVHREIADEQGLKNAKCLFLIRLNNKERASEIIEVAKLVRDCLGPSEVLLLIENENEIR